MLTAPGLRSRALPCALVGSSEARRGRCAPRRFPSSADGERTRLRGSRRDRPERCAIDVGRAVEVKHAPARLRWHRRQRARRMTKSTCPGRQRYLGMFRSSLAADLSNLALAVVARRRLTKPGSTSAATRRVITSLFDLPGLRRCEVSRQTGCRRARRRLPQLETRGWRRRRSRIEGPPPLPWWRGSRDARELDDACLRTRTFSALNFRSSFGSSSHRARAGPVRRRRPRDSGEARDHDRVFRHR